MKFISKAMIGTVAAGAMALASASPVMARDRDRDGIDGKDILAGALIIGGIAAVAAAAGSNNDRDRYEGRYDRGYDDHRYDRRYGNHRYDDRRHDQRGYRDNYRQAAVAQCVQAAEQTASRYTYGRAQVYDIRDVDRERGRFEVKGRIAVQDRGRGYRQGWDQGRFSCDVRRGRVVDLDFSGIRGL